MRREPRTVLRYAVEVVLPRAARLLGLLEPVLERVVYEDVPANLLALKHRVETLKAQRHVTQLELHGMSCRHTPRRKTLNAAGTSPTCVCQ